MLGGQKAGPSGLRTLGGQKAGPLGAHRAPCMLQTSGRLLALWVIITHCSMIDVMTCRRCREYSTHRRLCGSVRCCPVSLFWFSVKKKEF